MLGFFLFFLFVFFCLFLFVLLSVNFITICAFVVFIEYDYLLAATLPLVCMYHIIS